MNTSPHVVETWASSLASKAEPDIWMRHVDDHYEYIATYVDNLAISSKDPKAITDTRNELCISPQWYIEKLLDNYKCLFGKSPLHHSQSPLESNDHPEINSSKFLGEDDIQKYQSLIGAMQWAISIGHFDIAVHFMMMSSFRASPHHGHLE
jgi:hypothetical protein